MWKLESPLTIYSGLSVPRKEEEKMEGNTERESNE